MSINDAKTVLMVGIAGSGMRGLAYLLAEQGKQIIGTDRDLDALKTFSQEHKYVLKNEKGALELLEEVDAVVLTDALAKDNLIIKEAKKKGIEMLLYHEALAQLVNEYKVIAVAGTHGKTSTSALLSHIMIGGGLDPSALLGASIKEWQQQSARLGKGGYFIVEADEYRNHFFELRPEIGVITSIDYDHADFFASLDDVHSSFSKFISNVREDGSVIVGRKTYEDHPKVIWHKNTVIVEGLPKDFKATIYGEHMRQNAALAIKVSELVGVTEDVIVSQINNFGGAGRRMEEVGEYNGKLLISDYGHHPAEIVATLKLYREKYVDKKVLVVFEAHTLKRLTTFKDEFIKALAPADGIVLAPVFVPLGREKESEDAKKCLELFFEELKRVNGNACMMDEYSDFQRVINNVSDSFDVVLAFTAGNADRHLRELVNKA